jgi:K+-sensing histidine kinase KdpD
MKSKSFSNFRLHLTRSMFSVGIVFVLTSVMVLIGSRMLGEGVVALLYLVPIGWCTVRWGKIAGISAALSAALCFDYLFIPPYYTFNIGSMEGWLLLILFIATAILVVGRIQTILAEIQNRERKAVILYEMVAAIAAQPTREGIAKTLANQIQEKYLAKLVQVTLNAKNHLAPLTICSANGPDYSSPKDKPDRALPVISGPDLIGEIAIWQGLVPFPPADDPMLQSFLHQTAAALDRALITEENLQTSTQSLKAHHLGL